MPLPKQPKLIRLAIPTPDGDFVAGYSERGLAELLFPSSQRIATTNSASATPAQVRQWHDATSTALKQVLSGRTPDSLPPLDMSDGTEFQLSVWQAMKKIRPGQTRSYGEIAKSIGKPKAVRAVGGACGANPIPVLVPCHRVLAANQKIGGFGGGLDWKRRLLKREGVTVDG
jgi:O-6-methylguanine DNA methyltransferase